LTTSRQFPSGFGGTQVENTNKRFGTFLRRMKWIFWRYMEAGQEIMLAVVVLCGFENQNGGGGALGRFFYFRKKWQL